MPEPTEHVGDGERRQIAEATEPEPAEQLDQLGVALAERLQPADREVGAERRRRTRLDDHRCLGPRRAAEPRAATLEANRPSATPMPITCRRRAGRSDRLGQPLGQPVGEGAIAAEVPSRPTCQQADPAGFDHVETRGQLGDGTHDRLELAGVTVGVTIDQRQVRTASLRLPTALADHHAVGSGSRRAGDHPVRPHHRCRHVGTEAGSGHRPVGEPDRHDPRWLLHRIAPATRRPSARQCEPTAATTVQTTAGRLDDEPTRWRWPWPSPRPTHSAVVGVEHAVARQRPRITEHQHDDISLTQTGGDLAHRRR